MIQIKQGNINQSGLYLPLSFSSKTLTFSFTESCKYSNTLSNSTNIQKLFGVALFSFFGSFKTTKTKKWWELHKWLSIRLGWRYNEAKDYFELMDYCYIDGIGDRLAYDKLKVFVKVGEEVKAEIKIIKNKLQLVIEHNNKSYIIKRDCKTPTIMLFFLKLRAYIEPKISTHNYTIKTY